MYGNLRWPLSLYVHPIKNFLPEKHYSKVYSQLFTSLNDWDYYNFDQNTVLYFEQFFIGTQREISSTYLRRRSTNWSASYQTTKSTAEWSCLVRICDLFNKRKYQLRTAYKFDSHDCIIFRIHKSVLYRELQSTFSVHYWQSLIEPSIPFSINFLASF